MIHPKVSIELLNDAALRYRAKGVIWRIGDLNDEAARVGARYLELVQMTNFLIVARQLRRV